MNVTTFMPQILMSVLKTLTTVRRIVQTFLEATNVSVMMDILLTLINTHAMVVYSRFNAIYFTLTHLFPRH